MSNEITEVLEEQALPQRRIGWVEVVEEQEYTTLRPITKTQSLNNNQKPTSCKTYSSKAYVRAGKENPRCPPSKDFGRKIHQRWVNNRQTNAVFISSTRLGVTWSERLPSLYLPSFRLWLQYLHTSASGNLLNQDFLLITSILQLFMSMSWTTTRFCF